ncbi:MAG: TetR family transcriptional regulator [Actinomycetota bacterium]
MNKSRGRPAADGRDRRARILEEARRLFLERGYVGTTLRSIAAAAEVDVALLGYYFGSKQDLFAAAIALQLRPAGVLHAVIDEDPARVADRLLRAVLVAWENPALSSGMREFVAAALGDEDLLRSFREYIEREVVGALSEALPGAHARVRALAAVQIIVGLIFSRYILRLEPFASMSPREAYRALRGVIATAISEGAAPRSVV